MLLNPDETGRKIIAFQLIPLHTAHGGLKLEEGSHSVFTVKPEPKLSSYLVLHGLKVPVDKLDPNYSAANSGALHARI